MPIDTRSTVAVDIYKLLANTNNYFIYSKQWKDIAVPKKIKANLRPHGALEHYINYCSKTPYINDKNFDRGDFSVNTIVNQLGTRYQQYMRLAMPIMSFHAWQMLGNAFNGYTHLLEHDIFYLISGVLDDIGWPDVFIDHGAQYDKHYTEDEIIDFFNERNDIFDFGPALEDLLKLKHMQFLVIAEVLERFWEDKNKFYRDLRKIIADVGGLWHECVFSNDPTLLDLMSVKQVNDIPIYDVATYKDLPLTHVVTFSKKYVIKYYVYMNNDINAVQWSVPDINIPEIDYFRLIREIERTANDALIQFIQR